MKWLAVAALCVSSLAQAGTRDPSTPDSRHVEYGAKFKCIVKVRTRRNADNVDQFASGVVIGKRHVLTAAHVVIDTKDWSVEDGERKVAVKGVSVHPQFTEARFGHSDVAIATLSEDWPLDFYPPIYRGDSEPGAIVSICGYGVTGTFDTGYQFSDGIKRAGSNIIDRTEAGMLVCSVLGGRKTALEFLITPGDSGGGLFIGNELAGINSVIMRDKGSPSGRYGDESGHTRLTLHREWILKEVSCDE